MFARVVGMAHIVRSGTTALAVAILTCVVACARQPQKESMPKAASAPDAGSTAPPFATVGTPTQPDPTPWREQIRLRVRGRLEDVLRCYEGALDDRPALRGTATVTFLIGASGVVEESSASGLGAADVEHCITDVIRSIVFPSSSGPTRVTYPFTFKRISSE